MNITRDEARARSQHLSARSYEVSLDLTGRGPGGAPLAAPDATFVSTSRVAFTSDGTPTWLDLIAESVLAASLDGVPLDPALFAGNRLPLAPTPGEHVAVVTALCRYSRTGEGLHRTVDPADGRVYCYTQFEEADARRAYACFEQPDLKATFQLTAVVPQGWVVASNATNPATARGGQFTTWRFPATPPISTYITAVIAGQYHVDAGTVVSRKGELPAALLCRESLRDYLDAGRIRTSIQRGVEVYEAAFGLDYPFDSFDQAFVPEYNAGAMENAAMVTVRDEMLWRSPVTAAEVAERENALLHELAHMWFGDLVTMRWWDDLWLNESFAEWASHYCQEQIVARHGGVDPWPGFTAGRKAWAFQQDQMPTTHPVAADMVDLEAVRHNFDGITYAKGASVLQQLVGLVGEAAFLRGVQAYLTAHAWGNATLADLLGALHEASGVNLTTFAADWLETAGMNTLRLVVTTDQGGVITAARFDQSAPEDHPTLRRHHLGVGGYDLVDGRLRRTFAVECEATGPSTPLPQLVGRPRPALLLPNDGDMTFAKIRFDDASLEVAVAHAADLDDPLARTLVFMTLRDMWRDAELPGGDFLAVVLAGLPDETDMTALRARLYIGRLAAIDNSAPAVRPANQTTWLTGLRRLLDDAAPGGDTQLALAAAVVEGARAQDADLIAGWLDGTAVPDGLVIAPELRWASVRALARLDRTDEAAIEAELRRDPTQTGLEQAAGARAALASPTAKAEAWRAATATDDLPNTTLAEVCDAFWQFGQEDLTRDYAPAYLEVAGRIAAREGIWEHRGAAVADAVLTQLWPTPVADEAFVEAAEAWLAAHPQAPASAARILRECIDRTKRTRRIQAASIAAR